MLSYQRQTRLFRTYEELKQQTNKLHRWVGISLFRTYEELKPDSEPVGCFENTLLIPYL